MKIQLSDGSSFDGSLVVRNVTGIAEEKGYRLYWENPENGNIVPALGLVTSNPFRTEREAKLYGRQHFARQARRIS